MRACEFIIEQEQLAQQEKFINLILDCDRGTWTVDEAGKEVVVQYSQIYDDTLANKSQKVIDRVEEFINVKRQNPVALFGNSDTPFIAEGPLAKAVPKLRHAHLSQDVSVFYKIDGSNPTVIKLYGLFSHKESGTGNASNVRIQKQLGARLKNLEN